MAGLLIELHAKIAERVKDLPDEEVLRLAEACDKESEPGESPFDAGSSKNFPMPEWAEVAKVLRKEVWLRRARRAADKHMAETGESYYCVSDHLDELATHK